MNSLMVTGWLTKDPSLKYLEDGTPLVKFTLASRYYAGGAVQRNFISVAVFGKQAENCNTFLKRGSYVGCKGELQLDRGTGNPRMWVYEGKTYTSCDMVASDVEFGPKEGGGEDEGEAPTMQEDDLPF